MDPQRFMAPGPWATRDLKECVLASAYDTLRRQVADLERLIDEMVDEPCSKCADKE